MSRQSARMNVPVEFGHNVIGTTNGSCGDCPLPGRGDHLDSARGEHIDLAVRSQRARLPICMPVMRRTNQRAYKSARPVSPVLPAAEGLRATICWLVYSRVVLPVLVLQTRVSIQSGRSCFSICRELSSTPDIL